ncbi:hypothetical protein GF386_05120 [Candidatus Pacearchaeota archaeon]|nr:hypothetical protein [Candidatus Pacearchaeota archaeon]MBD3283492.1 hypothetical protein [Candidatus Pacearchaeota archaeon]
MEDNGNSDGRNAYEQEAQRRASSSFYQQTIEQIKGQDEQRRLLRAPLEELVSGHEGVGEAEIDDCLRHPDQRLINAVSNHLIKLRKEAEEGKNLSQIIDTAPYNILVNAMGYVNPQTGDGDEEIRKYHTLIRLGASVETATKNGDQETLNRLRGSLRDAVKNHLETTYPISEDFSNGEDYTFENFMRDFADGMSEEYVANKFNDLASQAVRSVTAEENEARVRNYMKNLPVDERPALYEALYPEKKS